MAAPDAVLIRRGNCAGPGELWAPSGSYRWGSTSLLAMAARDS